jgi:hypothetical protein
MPHRGRAWPTIRPTPRPALQLGRQHQLEHPIGRPAGSVQDDDLRLFRLHQVDFRRVRIYSGGQAAITAGRDWRLFLF